MGYADLEGGGSKPTTSKPSTSKAIVPASDSGGFWGSIGHAAGAAAGWLKRAGENVVQTFSPVAHDFASLIGAAAPGVNELAKRIWGNDPSFKGGTAKQVWDASRLIKPLYTEAERRIEPYAENIAGMLTGKKPVTPSNLLKTLVYDPKLLEKKTYITNGKPDPGKLLRELASESPGGMVVPVLNTAAALTTKSGRHQALYENPGFTILDLLPLAEKVSPLLKAIGRSAEETRVGMGVSGALDNMKPSAAALAGESRQIGRKVMLSNMVRDVVENVGPSVKGLKSIERDALTRALQFADPPEVGTVLRDAYDAILSTTDRSALAKQAATLPPNFVKFLTTQALEWKQPGQDLTQYQKLAQGISRITGMAEEDALATTRYALQALYDEAPNPFPHDPLLTRVWNEINKVRDAKIQRAAVRHPLYKEPVTESLFTYDQVQKLRRSVAGGRPGRGTNLTNVAKDVWELQDAPPPEAIVAKRAELVRKMGESKTTVKPGNFTIDIDPRGRYWARSKTSEVPHLGPYDSASEAAKAVRSYVQESAPNADIAAQIAELDDLTERLQKVIRYKKTVADMTPARWKPMMEAYLRQAREDMNAARLDPEMRAAYKQMADDAIKSAHDQIFEWALKGKKPVYVHREALAGEAETVRDISLKVRKGGPSSSKPSSGLANTYTNDAVWGLFKDEAEWAMRDITLDGVSKGWVDDGARTWFGEMAKHDNNAALVKKHFRAIDIDKQSGYPTFSEPREGSMLVTRAYAHALENVFNPRFQKSVWNTTLGIWMAPTLGLAPVFQMNNVLGGAILYGLRAGGEHLNLLTLLKDAKSAFSMALKGEILDPRIPGGTFGAPKMTRYMSPGDEIASAGWYGEGLGSAFRHWYGDTLNPVKKALDFTDKMNQVVDATWKNMTAMSHSPGWKGIRNLDEGLTGITDEAVTEASRLLQNVEAMTPFEREVMQRAIPFYAWRRTLIGYVTKYPVDHPVRTTILNQVARLHEEQREVSQWLDDYLLHYLPVGEKSRDAYQKYLSIRGLDPFADYSNMATLKGWLASVHPLALLLAKVFAHYDPFIGGVRAHARSEETTTDPDTGAQIYKPDWDAIKEFIPQMRALSRSLEIEPPDDQSPEGWWKWWKKYGAGARLLPALQYINIQQEELKHLKEGEKPSFKEPKAKKPKGSPSVWGSSIEGPPASGVAREEIYKKPLYDPRTAVPVDQNNWGTQPQRDVSA